MGAGDRIILTKFKDYYLPGVPSVDKVVFRFIEDASAQMAALRAGMWTSSALR